MCGKFVCLPGPKAVLTTSAPGPQVVLITSAEGRTRLPEYAQKRLRPVNILMEKPWFASKLLINGPEARVYWEFLGKS